MSVFFSIKKKMFSTTSLQSFLSKVGCMQSPACGRLFCCTQAWVASVILGTGSKPRDVLWLFLVYFYYITKQHSAKFFRSSEFISPQIPIYDCYTML